MDKTGCIERGGKLRDSSSSNFFPLPSRELILFQMFTLVNITTIMELDYHL